MGIGHFADKVVLITGAAGGIGKATTLAFLREGARVCLADLAGPGIDAFARELKEDQDVLVVRVDVTSENEVASLMAQIEDRYGRLDVAFNNAGMHHIGTPLHETSEEVWDRVQSVNLKGMFFCLKHEIPLMIKGGGGAIVNTSSAGGLRAAPGVSAYVAAKHGVVGLTKAAALEYAANNIRVNAICPGATETPMLADWLVDDSQADRIKTQHPIGRWAQPREMADAVLFLASNAASFVSGVALPVDGGIAAT